MGTRKGWKMYDHGLVCRGKQYTEGEIAQEPEAKICEKGMHYCDNPMDLMAYHDLIGEDGELAEITEVEDMAVDTAQEKTDGNTKKYCTTKLKIGAQVAFKDWVKASVDILIEKTKASPGDYARLASSWHNAQLASSWHNAQLASSGDYAQLASSGDNAQLASSGKGAQLASSGYYARLASSGNGAQLASSGDYARLASSGDGARLASSGNNAQLASSGNGAQLASSGYYARLASSGNGARLASSGDGAVICCAGFGGKARAKKGSWITLAEWKDGIPVCVKTEYVDGERIKEDTWYMLENGEFCAIGDKDAQNENL